MNMMLIPILRGTDVLVRKSYVDNKYTYKLPSIGFEHPIKTNMEKCLDMDVLRAEVFMRERKLNEDESIQIYKVDVEGDYVEGYQRVNIVDLNAFLVQEEIDAISCLVLQALYWYYCGIKNSVKSERVI